MKKTLYAKYNRIRLKQFQTKIEIVEQEGKPQVIRTPLNKEAATHVKRLLNTYKNYPDYYNQMRLETVREYGESVMGEYITGVSFTKQLEQYLGDDTLIFDKVKEALGVILDINEKYCVPFQMTERFQEFFGEVEGIETYEGDGVSVCNFDPIFDNIIQTEDSIVVIDYEWMYEVTIPKEFLVYRVLKIFYEINSMELRERYTVQEFLEKCGLNMANLQLFIAMEDGFLAHVYGVENEAIYTDHYKKNLIKLAVEYAEMDSTIHQQQQQLELKDAYISQLEKAVKEMKKLRYSIKRILRLPLDVVKK